MLQFLFFWSLTFTFSFCSWCRFDACCWVRSKLPRLNPSRFFWINIVKLLTPLWNQKILMISENTKLELLQQIDLRYLIIYSIGIDYTRKVGANNKGNGNVENNNDNNNISKSDGNNDLMVWGCMFSFLSLLLFLFLFLFVFVVCFWWLRSHT